MLLSITAMADLKHLSQVDSQAFAFHFGEPPRRVDFLTKMAGLNFDDAEKKNQFFVVEGKKIPVLNIDELIVNKMYSGRMKDKADIEELQKIMRLKKK
jgi:hypothetical protein